MINPCEEITLGEPQLVVPWVQIQMMNHLRVKEGKPPFTPQEILNIELQLTECRACGLKWNDPTPEQPTCELCGRGKS